MKHIMTNLQLKDNIFVLTDNKKKDQNEIYRLWKSHWVSDYAADIYDTMKEAELRRRPMYFVSSQIDERQKMLHLCQLVTSTHKLSRCALHLAIYYMDRFVDHFQIRPDKLSLVALVCLHLAAQIESTDASVPRYSEMNPIVKHAYEPYEYKAVERKVLTFFDFHLIRPTTVNFVELFACSFITRNDYAEYMEMVEQYDNKRLYDSFEEMLSALSQLLLHMADYTLNVLRFGNELPSILAAACIGAVRQVSGLPNRWTPYLTQLTSYREDMIEPYLDILTLYHYYQTTSVNNLDSLITELEDEYNYPSSHNKYQIWSIEDSGFAITMFPSTSKSASSSTTTSTLSSPSTDENIKPTIPSNAGIKDELESINIISVQQIRKPNLEQQQKQQQQPLIANNLQKLDKPNPVDQTLTKCLKRRHNNGDQDENEKLLEQPLTKKLYLN